MGFTDRVEKFVPPDKGVRHALRLLRDILYFEPRHTGTDLAAALDHLNKAQKRRAVVFLFSDFLGSGYADQLKRAGHRHDLIAVRTTDPREESLPAAGLVNLEDAETGRQVLVDTNSERVRAGFAAAAAARRAEFVKLARSARADVIEVGTAGDHFDALLRFFRTRGKRRR